VTLVILDVDDTLFDWLGMWSTSFSIVLDGLTRTSTQSRAEQIAILRQFHVAARTSEREFTTDDHRALNICEQEFRDLIEMHERSTTKLTIPFDGVLTTIISLKAMGVRVVAHTDTPRQIAEDRFVKLGFDGIVDALFATQGNDVTTFRRSRLTATKSAIFSSPYLKPDPRNVLAIMDHYSVCPADCIYVGDSKTKDMPMARAAGVRDVFAAYGCQRSSDAYSLLRSVSHWTDEDIAHEQTLLRSEATYSIASFPHLISVL